MTGIYFISGLILSLVSISLGFILYGIYVLNLRGAIVFSSLSTVLCFFMSWWANKYEEN